MDFRHLKYFVAVADEQNFTRAAERLHISQPPLSRQIQDLEEELGTPLFERGSRPLKLTDAGRFFYGHATRLLEQAAQAVRSTKRIAQLERRLVVGFVSSTMYGALPLLVRKFRAANPQTELALTEMSTVEQIDALKIGRIDVGFGRVRLDDPSIKREILREERLVVAIPSEHELARGEGALTLRDVAAQPLLVYPRTPRPSYADQVLSLLRDLALEPASVLEVQEMQTALGLVASGMGLCVVPASVHRLRPDEVVYRPLAEAQAVSPIIMSTRLQDQSADIALMRQLIDEIYAEQRAAREAAQAQARAGLSST
ncbi:LysR family transcriptional regulator [Pelomonas aquatica]|jgi:DNA-binding transcriptional LysR family regulator|uniref:LysR family transcriptional regulator n=1 Tax=Pelomonas aquatica TaxID=431058 RepID=A0A9X4LHK8_9BURK|nr:LysR family transcriptional regulator [Pelomonas aquatica]MCY4755300.1 LysR family transcriptional regulator [Pelomonas aquatica]MDG0862607.1 LysR family transcriptional regulator [Pelomonas aquatica]